MDTPLVSIILPTFNGARFLSESIDSCLAQTYCHIEVIIVDDASTDETPRIIQEFVERDARIRVIRHVVNRRLPAALNTGISAAQGDFITWTSDDNLYHPEAISVMIRALKEHADASFVYTDFDIIDENGAVLEVFPVTSPRNLLVGGFRCAGFLYRREIVDAIGDYATDLALAEDYDYWLRIYAARFIMIPLHQSVYSYRQHERSLTDTHRGKTFAAAEAALLRHLPRMTWLSRKDWGQVYLYLASLASWQHNYRRAMGYVLRTVALTPIAAMSKLANFGTKLLRKSHQ